MRPPSLLRRTAALGTLSLVLALPSIALAQGSTPSDVSPNRTVSGANVDVTTPVAGDLVAAGGNVNVFAKVEGDVIAAGGTIVLHEDVGGDVRVAGGNVRILRAVGGEALLAGGTVQLEKDATIAQGARIAGGNLQVDGTIHGASSISGGNLVLSGTLDGAASIDAGSITVIPGAVITGDLRYSSAAVVDGLAPIVRGKVTFLPATSGPSQDTLERVAAGFSVLWLIVVAFTALLLLLLLPNLAGSMSSAVRARPLMSIGAGLLTWFAILPIVIAIATVVGMPLGLVALGTWVALVSFSGFFLPLLLGELLLRTFRIRPTLGWRVLGVVVAQFILMTVGELPYVTYLVTVLEILALGSVMVALPNVVRVEPSLVDGTLTEVADDAVEIAGGPATPLARGSARPAKRPVVSKKRRSK